MSIRPFPTQSRGSKIVRALSGLGDFAKWKMQKDEEQSRYDRDMEFRAAQFDLAKEQAEHGMSVEDQRLELQRQREAAERAQEEWQRQFDQTNLAWRTQQDLRGETLAREGMEQEGDLAKMREAGVNERHGDMMEWRWAQLGDRTQAQATPFSTLGANEQTDLVKYWGLSNRGMDGQPMDTQSAQSMLSMQTPEQLATTIQDLSRYKQQVSDLAKMFVHGTASDPRVGPSTNPNDVVAQRDALEAADAEMQEQYTRIGTWPPAQVAELHALLTTEEGAMERVIDKFGGLDALGHAPPSVLKQQISDSGLSQAQTDTFMGEAWEVLQDLEFTPEEVLESETKRDEFFADPRIRNRLHEWKLEGKNEMGEPHNLFATEIGIGNRLNPEARIDIDSALHQLRETARSLRGGRFRDDIVKSDWGALERSVDIDVPGIPDSWIEKPVNAFRAAKDVMAARYLADDLLAPLAGAGQYVGGAAGAILGLVAPPVGPALGAASGAYVGSMVGQATAGIVSQEQIQEKLEQNMSGSDIVRASYGARILGQKANREGKKEEAAEWAALEKYLKDFMAARQEFLRWGKPETNYAGAGVWR